MEITDIKGCYVTVDLLSEHCMYLAEACEKAADEYGGNDERSILRHALYDAMAAAFGSAGLAAELQGALVTSDSDHITLAWLREQVPGMAVVPPEVRERMRQREQERREEGAAQRIGKLALSAAEHPDLLGKNATIETLLREASFASTPQPAYNCP